MKSASRVEGLFEGRQRSNAGKKRLQAGWLVKSEKGSTTAFLGTAKGERKG